MNKPAVVGLVSGLAVVVSTLIAVGVINMPEAKGDDSVAGRGTVACGKAQMSADQGYGWTRKDGRTVCGSGD